MLQKVCISPVLSEGTSSHRLWHLRRLRKVVSLMLKLMTFRLPVTVIAEALDSG